MTSYLFIEGAETKKAVSRCREAFAKLFMNAGLPHSRVRFFPSGSRDNAFRNFANAKEPAFLLVDSEDPLKDLESAWAHLKSRDSHWKPPSWAANSHVLFMTTCMETWIVADRDALKRHYGQHLQESALPALVNLENQHRHIIHKKLIHATRNCQNQYRKGERSFKILAELNPDELQRHLPSFARVIRILRDHLSKPEQSNSRNR